MALGCGLDCSVSEQGQIEKFSELDEISL